MKCNVSEEMKCQIRRLSKAIWKEVFVKYLGIYLSVDLTMLAKYNLTPNNKGTSGNWFLFISL